MEERFYIVAYDIPDDRRRTKIAEILEDYGDRVQFSVFELVLDSPQRLDDLRRRVLRVIDSDEDSVRLYYLCSACRPAMEVLGLGVVTENPDVYVV